jgi:hypothetical protein
VLSRVYEHYQAQSVRVFYVGLFIPVFAPVYKRPIIASCETN